MPTLNQFLVKSQFILFKLQFLMYKNILYTKKNYIKKIKSNTFRTNYFIKSI